MPSITTISHTGVVTSGKFIPDNPEYFKWDVGCFEGKRIEVSVRPERRTAKHNRYYWGYVVRIFTDFFNKENCFGRLVDSEYVHELLKAKFLGSERQEVAGESIEVPVSSAKLSTEEFYQYTQMCKQWGEELFDLKFPDNEQTTKD